MCNLYAYIFESELRAMCSQASQFPNTETGGDLYGTWTYGNKPVIYLATGPGPNASAGVASFFQDNEYIMENERMLFESFGIQYLGDWHSHHVLNLQNPSSGDQKRINNLMVKSKRKKMMEIIISHTTTVLFENAKTPFIEKVMAYQYDSMSIPTMNDCCIRLLSTPNSIVRQHISSDNRFSSINLMHISPKIMIENIQLLTHFQQAKNYNSEANCFSDIISSLVLR